MRAATYAGAGGLETIVVRDDVAEPDLGSDDALVDVAYAGLNRADVLERRGLYPRPHAGVVVAGLEFSGIVRAVGAHVTTVAPGDRVCGIVASGAHAERLVTHAGALARVPDGLALRVAAALPEAFLTAYDALFARAGLRVGERVLVHAVGSGVGLAAVALAKRAGGLVIGTSRSPAKLARARDAGADFAFALDDEVVGRILAATDARGVDVILDFVGAPTLADNLAALADGGRIVQIGTLGGSRAMIDLGALMRKRAALYGTVLRSRPLDEKIALTRTFARDVLPLVARGELGIAIDRSFALADLRDAHAYLERDANYGKVVIAVAPGA